MFKKLLVFWILVVGCFSCQNSPQGPVENPTQIQKYFSIADFIQDQIERLEGLAIEKDLYVNGDHEQVIQRLSSEEWRNELDWFIQADINKASLATAYDIQENNGKTLYKLKDGEKSEIQEMTVFYNGERVDEVWIKSHDRNTFYQSETLAKLSTDALTGKLSTYELETTQKVVVLSPRTLKVKSKVVD
ncbi:hypothetical protein [Litoribacter populi]|uniref:hypothetical protein n=1 Tax=Litoribacter populi TaxID=2598460 RepID=UPI00117D0F44|nr:hypothetical protein [Litoribacter populi]